MASATVYIAYELSFGSPGTPVAGCEAPPDAASLNAMSWVPVDHDGEVSGDFGDPRIVEVPGAGSCGYYTPSQPATPFDPSANGGQGAYIQSRAGSMTLSMYPGGVGSDPITGTALKILYDSGWPGVAPTVRGDTPVTVGSVTKMQPGAAAALADYAPGLLIASHAGLCTDGALIIDSDGVTDTVAYTPETGADIGGVPLRFCHTWHAHPCGAQSTATIAMVIEGVTDTGDTYRTIAVGGVVTAVEWSDLDAESGIRKVTFDAYFPHIFADNQKNLGLTLPSAAPTCSAHGASRQMARSAIGSQPTRRGCKTLLTRGLSSTAVLLSLRDLVFRAENTTVQIPGQTVSGVAAHKVTARSVTLKGTLAEAIPAMDGDLYDGIHRNVMISYGPPNDGEGAVIVIPAAVTTLDLSRRVEAGTEIELRAGTPTQMESADPEIAGAMAFFGEVL